MATEKKRRATGPRSKAGCLTCRIRRVKCDEEKPSCQRCVRTGRTCDGYIEASANKPRDYRGRWELILPSMMQPNRPLSRAASPEKRKEERSLYFFRQRTISQLAGLSGAEFWRQIVCATHYSDTLRHSVIALASIHESLEINEQGYLHYHGNPFALDHQSRAMRTLFLRGNGEEPTLDIALVACLLFTCIEALQRNYGRAITHINSGIRIYAEYQQHGNGQLLESFSSFNHHQTPAKPKVPLEYLVDTFIRLDFQLSELLDPDVRGPPLVFYPERPPPFSRSEILNCSTITYLNTIEEARISLADLWHRIIVNPHEICPGNFSGLARDIHAYAGVRYDAWEIRRKQYLETAAAWGAAFRVLKFKLSSPLTLKDTEKSAMNVLEIQHVLMVQVLQRMWSEDEMVWDQYHDNFDHLVSLADEVISLDTNNLKHQRGNEVRKTTLNSSLGIFSLDLGIVSALFHIIWKCRDYKIRTRAINVLATCPRQEGLWDSGLVVKVGQRIVEIETAGAMALSDIINVEEVPIPLLARIWNVAAFFDPEQRKAKVCFSKYVSDDGQATKWFEYFDW